MIVWSVLARQDLRFIHQYIANDSKRYADRVIQDIVEKVEIQLETTDSNLLSLKSNWNPPNPICFCPNPIGIGQIQFAFAQSKHAFRQIQFTFA